jgi:hypothetical protein
MASIVERIGALAGTELSKAVDLAHRTYQDRVTDHRHVGRALVETVAEVCRNHPNLVGIGTGILVEQMLLHAKEKHDAQVAAGLTQPVMSDPASPPLDAFQPTALPFSEPVATQETLAIEGPEGVKNGHLPHHMIKLSDLRPGRVAMEVFGGILLLKLAATGAKMFRHKHQGEVWFAPAARIHLFSGTITAYNVVAAARSPKISAWRNGAIFFFGTDALKPILKPSRRVMREAAARRALPH